MLLSRNFFSEKHKYHLPHRKKGMFFPTQKKPAPFSLTQAGRKAKHNWSLVSANSASRRAASKRHVFPRARSKPSQPGKGPGGVGGGGGSQRATPHLLTGRVVFNGCWLFLRRHMNRCPAPTPPTSTKPTCAHAKSQFLHLYSGLQEERK